jgi:hypothetical protein
VMRAFPLLMAAALAVTGLTVASLSPALASAGKSQPKQLRSGRDDQWP